MSVIDSLEVRLQGDAKGAEDAVDGLNKKLDGLIDRISSLGSLPGLSAMAEKLKQFTAGISAATKSAEPQMQKISRTAEEISKKFENLGKGFRLSGTSDYIQKQIDSYKNALANAKLKEEELFAKGKIDTKAYEDAVANVQKFTNIVESLTSQLQEMQTVQPQLDIKTHGAEEAEQRINRFVELLREYDKEFQDALSGGGVAIGTGALESYLEKLRELNPEAKELIEAFEAEIERINDINIASGFKDFDISQWKEGLQLDINVRGAEEAGQQLDTLSGQWQNMANLFTKTFSDLKSGALWKYLTNGVQNYVKNAQLAAGIKVHTDDYKNVLKDIERTEGALEKLQQKQRDMQAGGTSEESKEWQKVASDISAAQSRLDSYINKRNEMESSGTDTQFSGGLANESILKSMGAVAGEAMTSLRQKIGEIGGAVSQAVGNIPIIGRIAKETAFLGQKAFEGFKFAVSGLASAAQKAVSGLSRAASAVAKLASGIKGAISNFSKLAKSMIGIKGTNKGMNGSFSGGLKTMLKYGLGIRSLYTLFNKLRTAAKEGFGNLAQYSPEVNASISSLTSSLAALKNSFAAAFAPILNVVAPYISTFIDMLTKAFNAVGRLFAALTGQSFAAQAKKNYTDYAASVSGAGKATKEAGKDVQKGIRAFDELKTISINKNEEEKGGAGGSEISPADMFETVPIEDNVSNFAQRLKDAWAAADFTEIGAMLGTKLNTALDSINWEPLKETASRIGKSIGTLINGFVEVDGLGDTIGRTIGEAINAGLAGINSFLDNTHWDSVGQFIGNGLNRIVNTVDWEGIGHFFAAKFNAIFETLSNAIEGFNWADLGAKLSSGIVKFIKDLNTSYIGKSISEAIKGLLDMIISFFENTDWKDFGNTVTKKVSDFFSSIDWNGIADRLFEGIGSILGGSVTFLWGLIEDAWNGAVDYWRSYLAGKSGQEIVQGLLDGIKNAVANIGEWVVEHIVTPFLNGFNKAFGIHSPSTVMAEQGGFIMQGLFNGISSLVDKVIGIFTKIKDKIVGIWDSLKTKTAEIWNGIKNAIKTPINAIIGFINGMVSGVVDGMNGMINALNRLSFDVPDWVPLIGGKTFGFNIGNISAPQIPYLAKGAVFRGGEPFLAVVNDQKRGQTNIEAPLKTIQEAVRIELDKFSANFKMTMPDTSIYSYRPMSAPEMSYDGAYGNYQHDMSAYVPQYGFAEYPQGSYNQSNSETNALLREQNELLKKILKKPIIDKGDIVDVTRSWYKAEAIRRYGNSEAFDPILG